MCVHVVQLGMLPVVAMACRWAQGIHQQSVGSGKTVGKMLFDKERKSPGNSGFINSDEAVFKVGLAHGTIGRLHLF